MHSAAIVEPDNRARGFEMDLVEAAEVVRDDETYDICCDCYCCFLYIRRAGKNAIKYDPP